MTTPIEKLREYGYELPRPKPFAGDISAKPRVVEPVDRSMGGLIGGAR